MRSLWHFGWQTRGRWVGKVYTYHLLPAFLLGNISLISYRDLSLGKAPLPG